MKFSIKSFRVPEIFIEVSETATIGSLKVLKEATFLFTSVNMIEMRNSKLEHLQNCIYILYF